MNENQSDGWHTFEELYEHRTILFSLVLLAYKSKAWRSKLHADGTMFDGYFIVGVDTDEGQFSYHCQMKYWDLFDYIKELPTAPVYDGHTSKDVVRLLSLSRKEHDEL